MKVLQLNVWSGRLERQIFELLNQEQPDIVCLQEAISLPIGAGNTFFLAAEDIQAKMGYNLSFAGSLSFQLMSYTAHWGNAVLAKPPIINQNILFTGQESFIENWDSMTSPYNIRNLLHTQVDIGGRPWHILTHHGHHIPDHKNGDQETLRQCHIIADYVSHLDGPIILTGDFNLAPHSESLEIINKQLTNLCVDYHVTTTRTSLTHKTEVCDYIFVNDQVEVQSFRISDIVASDHQALIMEGSFSKA
jgi:endonuclease/exonuclease/phosphatase family metal-dependent hydrolase